MVMIFFSLLHVIFLGFTGIFVILHYAIMSLFSHVSNEPANESFRKRVSVIVSAYNEENVIEDLIKVVRRSTYPIYEIVVVDDGSEDPTYEIARSLDTVVLRNRERMGKAASLARAVRKAKGEILVIFDADSLPHEDCVGQLVNQFVSEDVGAVAGCIKILDDSILGKLIKLEFSLCFFLVEPFSSNFNFFPIIHGANFAVRRDLAHFRSGALTEDFDLTIDLNVKGYKVRYEPRALCHVSAPDSFKHLMKQREKWLRGVVESYRQYNGYWDLAFSHLFFLGAFLKMVEYVIPLVWASSFTLLCICLYLGDPILLWTSIASIVVCTTDMFLANLRSGDKKTILLFIPFLSYFYNFIVGLLFIKAIVTEMCNSGRMRM